MVSARARAQSTLSSFSPPLSYKITPPRLRASRNPAPQLTQLFNLRLAKAIRLAHLTASNCPHLVAQHPGPCHRPFLCLLSHRQLSHANEGVRERADAKVHDGGRRHGHPVLHRRSDRGTEPGSRRRLDWLRVDVHCVLRWAHLGRTVQPGGGPVHLSAWQDEPHRARRLRHFSDRRWLHWRPPRVGGGAIWHRLSLPRRNGGHRQRARGRDRADVCALPRHPPRRHHLRAAEQFVLRPRHRLHRSCRCQQRRPLLGWRLQPGRRHRAAAHRRRGAVLLDLHRRPATRRRARLAHLRLYPFE